MTMEGLALILTISDDLKFNTVKKNHIVCGHNHTFIAGRTLAMPNRHGLKYTDPYLICLSNRLKKIIRIKLLCQIEK